MADSEKTVSFVVGAHDTSTYGAGDTPDFCEFDLTNEKLLRLERLADLVAKNGLNSLSLSMSPEWGPGNVAEDLRLHSGEVVVSSDSIVFTDRPKHSDYKIESKFILLSDLRAEFDSASDGDIIFPDNSPELKDRYFDATESEEDDSEDFERGG